jgi:hypothetical protein
MKAMERELRTRTKYLSEVWENYESNSDNNDNGAVSQSSQLVIGCQDHAEYAVDRVTLRKVVSGYFGFSYQFSLYRLLHIHFIIEAIQC